LLSDAAQTISRQAPQPAHSRTPPRMARPRFGTGDTTVFRAGGYSAHSSLDDWRLQITKATAAAILRAGLPAAAPNRKTTFLPLLRPSVRSDFYA